MRKTIADIVSEASSESWVFHSLRHTSVYEEKSKALDLELTSSSILIETGGKKMKKLLIIYYSWSNGNTERIAKMLQSETDSDILKNRYRSSIFWQL